MFTCNGLWPSVISLSHLINPELAAAVRIKEEEFVLIFSLSPILDPHHPLAVRATSVCLDFFSFNDFHVFVLCHGVNVKIKAYWINIRFYSSVWLRFSVLQPNCIMSEEQELTVTYEDGLQIITFNRPKKLNSITLDVSLIDLIIQQITPNEVSSDLSQDS